LAACKSVVALGKTSAGGAVDAIADEGGWLILSGVSEGKLEKNPQVSKDRKESF
jgi:hypothetical protein